jgi:hypothetical protein
VVIAKATSNPQLPTQGFDGEQRAKRGRSGHEVAGVVVGQTDEGAGREQAGGRAPVEVGAQAATLIVEVVIGVPRSDEKEQEEGDDA